MYDKRQIDQAHCQSCGKLASEMSYEERRENDGYTTCCNERVVGGRRNAYNQPVKCDPAECAHLDMP